MEQVSVTSCFGSVCNDAYYFYNHRHVHRYEIWQGSEIRSLCRSRFCGLRRSYALLTTNFNSPLKAISDLYHLQLNVFDMGWPAAAAVAYNTAVGALIIPICLGVNS